MNSTTNMICVFIGGVAVGALATVGVMKRIGYSKQTEEVVESQNEPSLRRARQPEQKDVELPEEDKPSFTKPERINTEKMKYHIPSKPDLEELAKKYDDESFTKHLADREHPEDDKSDEEEPDEDPLDAEMADALQDHPGQYEDECYDTDGYGHVLLQLAGKTENNLIYLVQEEWSGEIYPIENLRWFWKDDVLVDITDAPVDDPDRIIGSALEHFGECGDPDIVWVRNVNLGVEYEIERIDGSFAAYIYGVDEDSVGIPDKKGANHPAKVRKQRREEESEGGVAL